MPVSRKKENNKAGDLLHQPLDWSRVCHPQVQKWVLITLFSIAISAVIAYKVASPTYETYSLGEIAGRDIKTPQDFLLEDRPSTLEKRDKAANSVRAVYDYDLQLVNAVERKLESAFRTASEPRAPEEEKEPLGTEYAMEEFEELLGIPVSEGTFTALRKRKFDPSLLSYLYRIMEPVFEQGIVSSRELLVREKEKGIVLRLFPSMEETNLQDLSRIVDLGQARARVAREVHLLLSPSERSLEKPIVEIAQALLVPNVTFNKVETEQRRVQAREAVKAVLFEVRKGEMIVREGEKITAEHLLKLNQLRKLRGDTEPILYSAGNLILVFLILAIAFSFPMFDISGNASEKTKDLAFVGVMLLLITLMIRIGVSVSTGPALFLSDKSLFYLIPAATGAIVISAVMGTKQAAIFTVLISVFSTVVTGYGIEYFFYPFIGSLVGAREARFSKQRSTLLKAGFWAGLANIVVAFCLKMVAGTLLDWEQLVGDVTLGFLGGIFSGIVATGLVPLIELIFSYTTDVKLLELGNLNHPLLKELVIKAPGTYHHSIMTGSLVEATAEGIGANPLLARVGAYYHDVGKTNKSLYFIENQRGSENKHDRLSPNMSSLIIISHIKEGAEHARNYKLGQVITDIIQQHHGTSLISYFYKKAKEKEKPAEAVVDENDFRYPGPKPQTKEAGLIMLADAVEASSRTLADPTPARIQSLVNKTINTYFVDGQLDECELTLKDLHYISKSFHRILTGIFHHRIEYPERHENLDQEPMPETEDRFPNGQENGDSDIKRLGVS